MRVVVIGATGNIGTALVRACVNDPRIDHVVGVARRVPTWELPGVSWHAADISRDDLESLLRGADAVVHLAWLIQPSHDVELLEAVNVLGTKRVLEAAAQARVPVVVVGSSIGAYATGPPRGRVEEHWPTLGIPGNLYSQQK
ncbi:MAG: NAD-dependent epimerase/dehydratase, partial [Thermoleophilia bacterium]|nr:NAD-dependent epimerase/dehydratase [Thermoleophilia bacterium]